MLAKAGEGHHFHFLPSSQLTGMLFFTAILEVRQSMAGKLDEVIGFFLLE